VTSSSSIQDAGHQSYIDVPPDSISLLLMEASSKEEEVLCYFISCKHTTQNTATPEVKKITFFAKRF